MSHFFFLYFPEGNWRSRSRSPTLGSYNLSVHTIFGVAQTFYLFLVWNQATMLLFLLSPFET